MNPTPTNPTPSETMNLTPRDTMKRQIYNAAKNGDVDVLRSLLHEDEFLVHEHFSCSRNLLHVACVYRQLEVVKELVRSYPEMVAIRDSQGLSPMHIAASAGELDICSELLAVAPEVRWWRDNEEMNPVHVAAMKGNLGVVECLIADNLTPALERIRHNETVLHLCVKHGQLVVLRSLIEKLGHLVHEVDDQGENIMFLAVRSNQQEIVQYLNDDNHIRKLTRNSMDRTEQDILAQGTTNAEIRRIVFALRPPVELWANFTEVIMVTAALIATVAYQNTSNPPGGVWQDTTSSHTAGDSVMAHTNPNKYSCLFVANTFSFFISAAAIFCVIFKQSIPNAMFKSRVLVVASLIALALGYLITSLPNDFL